VDFVDLWVKGDLDMGLWLRRGRVEDDDVDLLEMLQESVEVGEMEPTAGVVPALDVVRKGRFSANAPYKFALAVEHIECVHDRVALDRRRCLATAKVIQAVSPSAAVIKEPDSTYSMLLKSCAVGDPAGNRLLPAPNEPALQEMGEPRKCLVNEAGLNSAVEPV